MIKAKQLLKKMTEHLSDWMIMRRNPEGSNGGKMLLGIAEEVCEIEKSIQEYVKTYFIDCYFNQTHAIPCEYMQIHVGRVELKNIEILNPVATVCTSKDVFEKACNYSYYEDGFLYFKPIQIGEKQEVTYRLNGKTFKTYTKRVPIWNVFDEFALYVGLERLERESNERLLERILFQSQHPVNSTVTGIQNAIANLTMLQPKDVIVEKIDDKNAHMNDFTGETLFEQLALLNRDIYRTKRWGVDYWQHDMNFSEYIPHRYDVKPGYYQDGIGDIDDLKIAMTRKDETVNMEVKAYSKDEKIITEYHKKYPIDTETRLKLYKPTENIEPIKVDTRIEAGTLVDISSFNFSMVYNATRTTCDKMAIEHLIEDKNIQITPYYTFKNDHEYRIKIEPRYPYSNFLAKVSHNGESLLEEQENFYINDFNQLCHKNTSLYANQLFYFSACEHFSHEINGFKLKPMYRAGELRLPLNNFQNKRIHIDITNPDFDPILESALSYRDFIKLKNEDAYESIEHSDSIFAIQEIANCIRFKVTGSATIFVRNMPELEPISITDDYFEIGSNETSPKDFLIHIIPANTEEKIKIGEIQYTYFQVRIVLDKGEISEEGLLPDEPANELSIYVQSYVSSTPTIHFIWVGSESLEGETYTTKSFTYTNEDEITLIGDEVIFTIEDLTDATETTIDNIYSPVTSQETCEILLKLPNYRFIENIVTNTKVPIIKRKDGYYLIMQKGQSVNYVVIQGEIVDMIKRYSLRDLLNAKIGAKYYISPIVENFIEIKDEIITLVEPKLPYLYGEYKIEKCEGLIPVFKNPKHIIESQYCKAPIQNFCLKLPNGKTYIAYNQFDMYEESVKNISVEKNFSPLLPYNEILFYSVTCLTPNATALFYNTKNETEAPYSVDIKPLNYKTDFSLSERLRNHYQEVILPIRLSKNIKLPDYVTDSIGNQLNLKEYLITPEKGIEVYYKAPLEEDIAMDPSYLQTEKIILDSKGFKKLKYCHIHEIVYCSFKPFAEDNPSDVNAFTLIKQVGLITFEENFIQENAGRILYIHYTVERPDLLILSVDKLYDTKLIPQKAYMHIFTKNIAGHVGDNIFRNELFKTADFVTVTVQEPGYMATATPEKELINVIETLPRNRITVHKGFYYCNGEEYYLFGENEKGFIEFKNDYIEAHNAKAVEEGLIFHSKSENLIRNSLFKTGPISRLFCTDFSELENINYFKRLNACEQINLWEHYNTQLTLDESLYGLGIHFKPILKKEIHFLGMPIEQIKNKDITISFWLKGNATAMIYVQEKNQQEAHLTLSQHKKVIPLNKQGYIHYQTLSYDPSCFYCLIIRGEGQIDDLIMCDSTLYKTSLHEKNLTKMFMPIFESLPSRQQRFLFNHQNGYTGTTQMLSNGDIVPTSNMSYGYTPLLDKDWMEHSLLYKAKIEDNCIIPIAPKAYCVTPVIKLDNESYINEIMIRSNFLESEEGAFIVLTGNSENTLTPTATSTTGTIKLEKIEKYLQVRYELYKPLYSLDISARYIEGATPKTYQQDYFESELFDLGRISDFKLTHIAFNEYSPCRIFIRTGKIGTLLDEYKLVEIDQSGTLKDDFQLGRTRYVQFKIYFDDSININYFDIEEVEGI